MEIKFSNDTVVHAVVVTQDITEAAIESIMVGAIEGGINYWGYVLPASKTGKPAEEPTSTWCAYQLLQGKDIFIGDVEDDEEEWTLTKEKLFEGIQRNFTQYNRTDIDEYDAEDYDRIIQCALFGKMVFG